MKSITLKVIYSPVFLVLIVFLYGFGDYSIELPNNYKLARTNAYNHVIVDAGFKIIIESNVETYSIVGQIVVGHVFEPTFGEKQYSEPGYFVVNTETGWKKQGMNEVEWNKCLNDFNIEVTEFIPSERWMSSISWAVHDEETGNYYNYFRDYDPAIGRCLQSDPIGLKGGLNTYVYTVNHPIRYKDTHGLFFLPIECLLNPEKCFGNDTGTCGPAEHRVYQNAVNTACKVKRACKKILQIVQNYLNTCKETLIAPINLKRSVGQREGCVCGGAGQGSLLHIHVPATLVHPCTARNDAE
jgi:RHS repeat-associated protein